MDLMPAAEGSKRAERWLSAVVSPYTIATIALVVAAGMAVLEVDQLLPWTALVALFAGWSAAWSP